MSWSPLDEKNPTDDALIGDEPFDLVSECFKKVVHLYHRDLQRRPSLRELVGTVQAVLEAQLQDYTSDGETMELAALTFKARKIPKRQKYAKGDVLKAKAANGEPIYARIFEIDPVLGPMVGVYESLGMSQKDVASIVQRPLIVKIFPIHREILEKRGWVGIGNRPLAAEDAQLPRGPRQIASSNQQLDAANYYYGLGPKEFFNIEDCVNQPEASWRLTAQDLPEPPQP